MNMAHKYLGVDLPLRFFPYPSDDEGCYSIGAHSRTHEPLSTLILVREAAMMVLMEQLTDKPNWHELVFDDEIVATWREDALTRDEQSIFDTVLEDNVVTGEIRMPREQRIITERIFTHCIMELRSKAKFFRENGFWYTLNYEGNHVMKSDSLVPPDLDTSLKSAFEKLIAEQNDNPKWRPGTNNRVLDIVDPSSYPFVYGKMQYRLYRFTGFGSD